MEATQTNTEAPKKAMFQYTEEVMPDGSKKKVFVKNSPYCCFRKASNVVVDYHVQRQLKPPNLEDNWEGFVISSSTYSKYGPHVHITITWKDDNYDNPPHLMEVSATTYEGHYDKTIEIKDFEKDLARVFDKLFEIEALY